MKRRPRSRIPLKQGHPLMGSILYMKGLQLQLVIWINESCDDVIQKFLRLRSDLIFNIEWLNFKRKKKKKKKRKRIYKNL
jgi:hypothetical protein